MNVRLHARLMVALVLLVAPAVQAGTVVESTSSANGTQTLSVEGSEVRIDPARTGAPGMLFDAERGRLILLNRPARQYNVIDAERLAELEARVAAQRERMERAIAEATGDERERLRRRLARLSPVNGGAAIHVETTGEEAQSNGQTCQAALARTGGTPSHRLCMAPVATLGLDATRVATLRSLFDFLARMRNLLGGGSAPFDARLLQTTLREHGSFPLRIERIDDGTSWTVRSIDEQALPEGFFDVPADYTEGARLGAG